MTPLEIPRRRNLERATGLPYEKAFTKTELMERGWTDSMIRRHLGAPNAVLFTGFAKYQYDTRTVYKAEATPAVQMDLLATEDVRIMGPRWLSHYRAYIPAMMKAALAGRAERADSPEEAAAYREIIEALPAPYQKTPLRMPPPPPQYQMSTE